MAVVRPLATVVGFMIPAVARHSERMRQIESGVRLRTLSIALENYALQHDHLFPSIPELQVGPSRTVPDPYDRSWPPVAWPVRASSRTSFLRAFLVPAFVKELPERDAWNYPLL